MGFTLIELLLVLVIIAAITAVTLPTFVRSMRGNRLRVAGQTVVMSGRYAWSMAILNQKDVAVRFDLGAHKIDISLAAPPKPPPDASAEEGDMPEEPVAVPDPDLDAVPKTTGVGFEAITRELDRVQIESVDVEDGEGGQSGDGVRTVVYESNGRCTPYTARLVDEHGDAVVIEVDALGEAHTERQDGF